MFPPDADKTRVFPPDAGNAQLCVEAGCFVGVVGFGLGGVPSAGVEEPEVIAAANDVGSFAASREGGL